MSRLVKIVVALALLTFIVVPGVTGFLVETSIEKAESGYGQVINSGPFELMNNSFERGWFTSDQSVELKLDEPEFARILHSIGGHTGNNDLPTLLVNTKATHGVIPLASPSRGGLRPAVAQTESTVSLKYDDSTVIPLPVKVYSSLGTGQWARVVADPIVNPDLGPDLQLNWDGADISASFGSTTRIDGEIGALKLNVASSDSRLETTPISVDGSFKETSFAFSENEYSMALEAFTISPPPALGRDAITVSDINLGGGLQLNASRAVATSSLNIGRVRNMPIDIDGVEIDAIYDLDAEALSTFIVQSRKLDTSIDSDKIDTDAMLFALTKLLSKGVSFDINTFDVKMGGGTLKLDLDLKLPAGSGSPQAIMREGEASGNIVIPESVVEELSALSPQLASSLNMASMMGFVQQKNGAYEARISYKQGVLLLNDLPVPIPF